jgi:hypothetical protein
MIHLLLNEHRRGKFYPLPAFLDPGAQKQRTKVLLHGARANAQLAGDLFITAPLDEQS